MYANLNTPHFDAEHHYAFLRKTEDELLIVVANFSDSSAECHVLLPRHAIECLGLPIGESVGRDLLTGKQVQLTLQPDKAVIVKIPSFGVSIYSVEVVSERE